MTLKLASPKKEVVKNIYLIGFVQHPLYFPIEITAYSQLHTHTRLCTNTKLVDGNTKLKREAHIFIFSFPNEKQKQKNN